MGRPLPAPVLVPTTTRTPCSFDHDLNRQTESRLSAQRPLAPVMPVDAAMSVIPSVTAAATSSSILPAKPSASDKRPGPNLAAAPSAKKHIVAYSLLHDRLGTSVADLSRRLHSAPSWASFVHDVRGPSYLASTIQDIPHTAAPYLQRLRDDGARVSMDDPPWDADRITACADRGPHPSAILHREFLRDEFADFIDAGFCWVILLEEVEKRTKNGLSLKKTG